MLYDPLQDPDLKHVKKHIGEEENIYGWRLLRVSPDRPLPDLRFLLL